MNVFFIIDEFPFFLPEYLDKTVIQLKKQGVSICGITPLITRKGHKTLYSYLIKNFYRMSPIILYKLTVSYILLLIGKSAFAVGISDRPYTIEQVARKNRIAIIRTTNVNDLKFLSILSKMYVDVVVSSCSQIFKQEILSLPKICCINRHSGLLPSYGGLFPVFQAMIHDERYVGVTIHEMVRKIDAGKILTQYRSRIDPKATLFELYRITYQLSVRATVKAIMNLKNKVRYSSMFPKYTPSYYSFPTSDDWNIFWDKHKQMI